MKLFDLHCDTASELYNQKLPLADGPLHISLAKTAPYENYVQIAAVWCDRRLSDEEVWERFWRITDSFSAEIRPSPDAFLYDGTNDWLGAARAGKRVFLYAVEDARLLGGELSRLDLLYGRGVRFLTLEWGGLTCIGGSHDTDAPLTDFGRAVVRRCFALGIIPDVSHASRAVTAEVIALAGEAKRPILATHSNSFSVMPHSRNLTDAEFRAIAALGGVVGVSLAPQHLCAGPCTIADAAAHILHYLSVGGEDALCLGCDFDGIGKTPEGLEDVSRLPALAEYLCAHGVRPDVVDKIFFENAYRFSQRVF